MQILYKKNTLAVAILIGKILYEQLWVWKLHRYFLFI